MDNIAPRMHQTISRYMIKHLYACKLLELDKSKKVKK